jgi:hypothetical protein
VTLQIKIPHFLVVEVKYLQAAAHLPSLLALQQLKRLSSAAVVVVQAVKVVPPGAHLLSLSLGLHREALCL